jgi:hypothetical protein
MDIIEVPLNSLGVAELRPDLSELEKINASMR